MDPPPTVNFLQGYPFKGQDVAQIKVVSDEKTIIYDECERHILTLLRIIITSPDFYYYIITKNNNKQQKMIFNN